MRLSRKLSAQSWMLNAAGYLINFMDLFGFTVKTVIKCHVTTWRNGCIADLFMLLLFRTNPLLECPVISFFKCSVLSLDWALYKIVLVLVYFYINGIMRHCFKQCFHLVDIVHLMHTLHVTPQTVMFCTQLAFGIVLKCTSSWYRRHERITASASQTRQ